MSAVLDLPKTTSIEKIYNAVEMAREQQAAVILSNVAWETYRQFVEETMEITSVLLIVPSFFLPFNQNLNKSLTHFLFLLKFNA